MNDPRVLVESGKLDELKALNIDYSKVSVNLDDNLLHIAAYFGASDDIIKFLLEKKVDPNQGNRNKTLPITYALERHNIKAAQLLLPLTKMDIADNAGMLVLHKAAEYGIQLILSLILDSKQIDIDALDDEGRSPLIHAASRGRKECVSELLERGASTLIKDKSGRNALMQAVYHKKIEAYDMLLKKTPEFWNFVDNDGNTLLHLLSYLGDEFIDIISKSVKKSGTLFKKPRFDFNKTNKKGLSALMIAAESGFKLTLSLLLKKGSDPKLKINGKTAKDIALEHGMKDLPKGL